MFSKGKTNTVKAQKLSLKQHILHLMLIRDLLVRLSMWGITSLLAWDTALYGEDLYTSYIPNALLCRFNVADC